MSNCAFSPQTNSGTNSGAIPGDNSDNSGTIPGTIPGQFRDNSGDDNSGDNSGDSIPNCPCLSFSASAFAAGKHGRPILPLSPKRLHLLKDALYVRVNGNIPSL
ncbi:hypothetical protein C4544_06105, partial [candidate division WS5 bacterium]